MPYMNIVQNYSANNRFEYNHKAIFAQVRKAMKYTGDKRDRTLQNILKENFLKDIKVYEPMKMNLPNEKKIYDMRTNVRYREAWEAAINRMAEPHQFFEQYVHIINEMAADIDKNYQPKFMLGLEREEAKRLVNAQIDVVSWRDDRIAWFNTYDITEKYGILRTRTIYNNPLGYDYQTGEDSLKQDAKQTYILKEYVKEQLKSKNFLWKLFNGKIVKAMKEYIRDAETALRDVNFPKEAENEAISDYGGSYYSDDARNAMMNIIDRKFDSMETRVQTEYTYGKEAAVNESYNIKQSPDPQNIPEGKRLVNKNLLKVGFVPKLKTLENDLKDLQSVQTYLESGRQIDGGASVKLADGTVLDTVTAETLKIAVENNIQKIQAINELPPEERREYIKSQLNDSYGFYTAEEKKDIRETIDRQEDPTVKANYEEFMRTELESKRYGAWSNMNHRAIEEIVALNAENGIEELGYTVPNLFLPKEDPVRENMNMDHLHENLNKGNVAPRIEGDKLVAENKMIV